MKIIHSLWTKPISDIKTFTGGWNDPSAFWRAWALSAENAKKVYGNVELVTDSYGAEILIDKFKLPYTNVDTCLDSLNVHPGLWAYGKIIAYAKQKEPFMHIDGDVFLWRKFSDHILKSNIIVQNLEFGPLFWYDLIYQNQINEMKSNLKIIPSCWGKFEQDHTAFCCGVFGGNNLPAIQYYCNQVKELVESEDNKDGWKKITNKGAFHVGQFNCAMEQFTAYCSITEQNLYATPLFYEDEMIYGTEAKAKELGYTHMMATKKGAPDNVWTNAIKTRIEKNRPDTIEAINKLVS